MDLPCSTAKILEYCEHHRGDPLSTADDVDKRTTDIGEWDRIFITVDPEMLFEIVLAANFLNIKPLQWVAPGGRATPPVF